MECRRDSLRDAGGAAAVPGADAHGDPAEGNGARASEKPWGLRLTLGLLFRVVQECQLYEVRSFQVFLLLPIRFFNLSE